MKRKEFLQFMQRNKAEFDEAAREFDRYSQEFDKKMRKILSSL